LKKNSTVSEGLDLENSSKIIVGEIEVELPYYFLDEGPAITRI